MTQGRAASVLNGRLGPAGAAVAIAGLAVNGLAFVVPLLGARFLSAADLGALAAILALGAITTVPAQGLQLALAVRWARAGGVPNAGRATAATACVASGAVVLAIPLISVSLHLSPVLPLLLAATSAAVVIASRWLGELQGQQRFVRLAVGMVLLAVARYGGVIAGLWFGAGVTGSLALGAGVAWASLPVLFALARPRGVAAGGAVAAMHIPRLRARDVAGASGANLAMLVISYADLILARGLLPPTEAGAYAVGAVLTKGALWAPQVVTVLAVPFMARGSRRALLIALAVVAGCGALLVVAAAVAGGLAVRLAGGPGYSWLAGYAPAFGGVGALYALVFVLVNAEVAAGARWPAATLWVAVVGLAIAANLLDPPTLGGILTLSVITATLSTATMGAVVWITSRRSARPLPLI